MRRLIYAFALMAVITGGYVAASVSQEAAAFAEPPSN